MRVLVTGGAGFIGAHLCEALLDGGATVEVFDDLSTGRSENLPEGVELTVSSVLESPQLAEALSKADGVVHLAAVASVPRCQAEPFETHTVNQSAFLHILEAARARVGTASPLRIVFASSAAVYGDASAFDLIPEAAPTAPISNYGVDKLGMELHAAAAAVMWGMESVGLRFFNVYGEGQDPASPYSGVISQFVETLRGGEAGVIFGDGANQRDFIHVSDVVGGICKALATPQIGFRPYNLCTGSGCSVAQLYDAVGKNLGITLPPTFAPPRLGDIRRSVGSYAEAARHLGFAPTIDLHAGLAQLCQRRMG